MAYYKNGEYLAQQLGAEFDATHEPGDTVPYSGIYRCAGCGNSSTNVRGHIFPPQGHQHGLLDGPIRWQLIVKSHWA
jgi:hypothetical protein